MIHHILKIVWNERKSNVLIFLEFILVFCVFWFCMDYLYYIGSRYLEPSGYDLNHTYIIMMDEKGDMNESADERYTNAMILKDRLEKYPGVEAVSFSQSAMPYGWTTSTSSFYTNDNDSVNFNIEVRDVTPEYFQVFRINMEQGRMFDEAEMAQGERVFIISGDRYGYISDEKADMGIPVEEVKTLRYSLEQPGMNVIGIVGKQKRRAFLAFTSTAFRPLSRDKYSCDNDIVIRIHPATVNGFVERFTEDMKDLTIGPYSFGSVIPMEKRQNDSIQSAIGNNLKSILAISAFLIINIFLGIIGTFWSRIESRKSEIGLRLALGSTKQKVRWQMFAETMVLLSLASIIGLYICVNLGQSELLEALGIPLADYKQAGFGIGHSFLNYFITFLCLASVSGMAVWYPARQSSNMPPADTLRDE